MRIGLYGMPTAGKTHLLKKIDFIESLHGSICLHTNCPDFDLKDELGKNMVRKELAKKLLCKETFIMDGHYAFGDKVAFTDLDGQLYDVFLYLYISPSVLKDRMEKSEKNKKYLSFDLEKWQLDEIKRLRAYCQENNKDFYVIDNPPDNYFGNDTEAVEFIKSIVDGFSCKKYADTLADKILNITNSDVITLFDGDKTITESDSSKEVFGYVTQIFDGNFYTGYQSWKQSKEFKTYNFDDLEKLPVSLNEKVCKGLDKDSFILTSGHFRVWKYISNYLDVPFFTGSEMSAETKYFITKRLQNAGKKVIAYGDGMNDYYMLKQADLGYLVSKKDGAISNSLNGYDLGGVVIV